MSFFVAVLLILPVILRNLVLQNACLSEIKGALRLMLQFMFTQCNIILVVHTRTPCWMRVYLKLRLALNHQIMFY